MMGLGDNSGDAWFASIVSNMYMLTPAIFLISILLLTYGYRKGAAAIYTVGRTLPSAYLFLFIAGYVAAGAI
jgi:hypothetical protein